MNNNLKFRPEQQKDKAAMTLKERAVYDFIRQEIEKVGVAPTRTEILRRFGYKSWENAQRFCNQLIKKGWIARKKGIWRGLYLPPRRFDSPPQAGFFWYYENNFANRRPVEVLLNGAMQLEQVELGSCQRHSVEKLTGKWEFISKGENSHD